MSLDNLVRIGKLKSEPPAQAELDGLIRSGKARLADAEEDDRPLVERPAGREIAIKCGSRSPGSPRQEALVPISVISSEFAQTS